MGKSSKPKKKYVPRQVRYPSLVTQINSFVPFENALNKLIETGECEIDSNGTLIFKDGIGSTQSFTTTLRIYMEIVYIYCKRKNLTCNLQPLEYLHSQFFEGIGLDEDILTQAKPILEFCKRIICAINPKELLDILGTVRVAIGLEKANPGSLKQPDVLLNNIKFKVGDLTEKEVIEKCDHFHNLVKAYPSNERYQKLRDIYVEYASAYRFVARMNVGA